jgi:hypothetical protein
VRTEITLGCCVVVGINIEGVIGAGLHAALAANTSLIVKVDDSVRTPVESFGGANGNAGGRIAVVTSHHSEVAAGVRVLALLHVLDPGAKDAHRHLVLFLARDGAGMTANAPVLINDEAVAHKTTNCT